ncbi:dipeptide/oligopeptide/nickel ABC transporter permease/ATP-binding protein [Mameliella alba]|uniref:dipeptide/oligopeptide/nickel ABC transporter permease/ATP-binding protein n=1 Tax=Mameliella alba TaxID=561184 RepID=UPI000B533E3C|nr:dipeptide/oligopeptide/nickel ABC transporter permease/ATP-binding protein [Mameliella alba]MBY6122379.1 dipeptide/oligopeptide/nickel ABC transporter permease/ATP-binding protein [Mameliella alba]OWV40808.1 peptide ABC transporter permease [Mameliella alba]OWV55199.1 peptide ABC transporter permease [Mameliella alba]
MAFLKLLARNRLALAGGIVLSFVVLLALITPLLPLAEPNVTNTAARFQKPFTEGALLGTDHLGRDLLSRLMWGTRLSLAVGFAAAVVAATLGAAIGIVAGFYGGRTDNLIMRGVDMLMAFPYILLALAIVAALGPGLFNALIAVAAVNVPFFARNIRGITVGIAHKEFVDAARLAGLSNSRIILTEILPNVIPVIVIAMSTTIGWMILETAGLSFLGLGSQPPQADLGSMLGEARSALITNPHTSVVPGIMILIIVMSINLLGDGVRDALDPRLKSGALSRPMASTMVRRKDPVPQAEGKGLLEVQELQTQFHVKDRVYRAVGGVSLHVKPGECLGVIGESGSGKSVTALSVMGLVASPPGVITGGAVRYDGEDLICAPYRKLREMRGRNVAYIFQDPLATLHPLYKVGDQLIEAIRAHRLISKSEGQARAIELLKAVRIPNAEKRITDYPHEMSGGMRQRVGIAMALANDPDIIIADEPTTALDVTVQAQILSLLDDLRRSRGLAIVFITHDFGVVGQLCDRVAVMYAGRIVEEGPTQSVLETPTHPYTARLMACVPELGEGKRRLEAIPGLPPVVDKLPEGCAFADRCDRVQPDCRKGEIALDREGARAVRCIHPVTPLKEAAE